MGKNDGNEKTCPAKIKWSWELENASPAAILTLKKALKDKWQRIAWKLESAMKVRRSSSTLVGIKPRSSARVGSAPIAEPTRQL
ncbi:mCG113617, isoform CRA_a [Mus musculus]|nr:mCG113617, isoform CRA_a [Mus musculus]